jgi:hypothetical protein
MHWRWYNPQNAQWSSEDPIGLAAGDANFRRYVGNNSLNSNDPSGLADLIPLGWDFGPYFPNGSPGRVVYWGVEHKQIPPKAKATWVLTEVEVWSIFSEDSGKTWKVFQSAKPDDPKINLPVKTYRGDFIPSTGAIKDKDDVGFTPVKDNTRQWAVYVIKVNKTIGYATEIPEEIRKDGKLTNRLLLKEEFEKYNGMLINPATGPFFTYYLYLNPENLKKAQQTLNIDLDDPKKSEIALPSVVTTIYQKIKNQSQLVKPNKIEIGQKSGSYLWVDQWSIKGGFKYTLEKMEKKQ